jgi:succinyl-CoA synthetase alpha subunit
LAILIDRGTRVIVQGITGRFGSFVTRNMLDVGTHVVAGVTPGRRGEQVWGIPVFNTIKEAQKEECDFDASVVLVPGPEAKKAVIEAVEARIKTILMEVERVPLHDALEVIELTKEEGVRLIGPGSAGLVSPGKASLGLFGSPEELARVAFIPGRVGVISRSGGQTTTLCWNVCKVGLGISTAINLGSEPILGTTFPELLPLFQADEETDAVAYFGEIGSVMEEDAAEIIKVGRYKKPLVAYIAGRSLAKGIRFSHASAIIEGGKGTAESKVKALREAGVHVVDEPDDIGSTLSRILKRTGVPG